MCRVPVSCADFEAILTPFSEVIRNRCLSFRRREYAESNFELGKPTFTPKLKHGLRLFKHGLKLFSSSNSSVAN